MKKAVCVVGTICSGKSTIASRISQSLNLPVLTETMFANGLRGVLNRISDYESIVIEHCELLKYLPRIEKLFSAIIVVNIDITESLAREYKRERIDRGGTGDFLKIDPVAMKKEIEDQLMTVSCRHPCIRVRIESDDDYEPRIISLIDELVKHFGESSE
jgi:dephospho-CoA kinase